MNFRGLLIMTLMKKTIPQSTFFQYTCISIQIAERNILTSWRRSHRDSFRLWRGEVCSRAVFVLIYCRTILIQTTRQTHYARSLSVSHWHSLENPIFPINMSAFYQTWSFCKPKTCFFSTALTKMRYKIIVICSTYRRFGHTLPSLLFIFDRF